MALPRRSVLQAIGTGVCVGVAGCSGLSGTDAGTPEVVGETLTLTTTTSTYDTGLLDELNAPFQTRYGVTVDAVALGTGAALETARNGDADVVLVHARSQEDEFMQAGYGVNRRDVMFNDFVIVGPPGDPAGVEGLMSALDAFEAIAESNAAFISRGDNSGTHTKEQALWQAAGRAPRGEWYRETGQGMGEVLNIASEQAAYTLSDRGTYLSQRDSIDLVMHVEGPIGGGPDALVNPYGILAVNPAIHDHVNYQLAIAYIGFMTSPQAQTRIREYEVNGEQLFFPDALADDPDFDQYVPEDWNTTVAT